MNYRQLPEMVYDHEAIMYFSAPAIQLPTPGADCLPADMPCSRAEGSANRL